MSLPTGYASAHNFGEQGAWYPSENAQITENAEVNRDPTRTTTLRMKFGQALGRRFRALKGIIREALTDLDVMGLKQNAPSTRGTVTRTSYTQRNAVQENQNILEASPRLNPQAFARDPNKTALFMQWLRDQNERIILETEDVAARTQVVTGPSLPSQEQRWTDQWVRRAYIKGVTRADVEVRKIGASVPELRNVSGLLNAPIHSEKLHSLYSRAFDELSGVTESMSQQIGRELAEGVAQGESPYTVARSINDRVDKVGITRAKTMARTEIIRAHNESALTRYEEMGIDEVQGQAEWATAGDSRVCPRCAGMEGAVFTIDQARGLIPLHPNCRCTWLPITRLSEKRIQRQIRVRDLAGSAAA